MSCVAKSDQSTGNATFASYVLRRARGTRGTGALRRGGRTAAAWWARARRGRAFPATEPWAPSDGHPA